MMHITDRNIEKFIEPALVGVIRFQNYNKDCFGMMDLNQAYKSKLLIETLITGLISQGVSPFTVLEPSLKKFGYFLKDIEEQEYPNDTFSIDVTDHAYVIEVGRNIIKENPDIDELLSIMEYR